MPLCLGFNTPYTSPWAAFTAAFHASLISYLPASFLLQSISHCGVLSDRSTLVVAFSWFVPRASGSCTEILSSISLPFSNSTRSAMFPNMLYLDNACAPIATTCFISLVRPGHFFFYTWATILSPGLLEGGWWPFSQDYFSPLLTQRLIKNSGWCYWIIYYCDIRESLGMIALVML